MPGGQDMPGAVLALRLPGGEGCSGLSLSLEPRRGWEEAHAAGVATGQDGGADKGAVLLPGSSPCSEAALPPLGKGGALQPGWRGL